MRCTTAKGAFQHFYTLEVKLMNMCGAVGVKKRLLVEKQPKGSNRSASQISAMSCVARRVLTVKNFLIQLADVQRGEECEECSSLKSNGAPPLRCSSDREVTSESLPRLLQVRICKVCVSKHFFFFDNWVAAPSSCRPGVQRCEHKRGLTSTKFSTCTCGGGVMKCLSAETFQGN